MSSVLSSLPAVPEGQETFHYASQTSFWTFFKARRARVEQSVGRELEALGLSIASFGDPGAAYLALNPMIYTAVFESGMLVIAEAEFNLLVYPTARAPAIAPLAFEDFMLGSETQRLVGQLRLDVICDSMPAILGGRLKYGEHKFPGQIRYRFPTWNNNPKKSSGCQVDFVANQAPRDGAGEGEGMRCFQFRADTGSLVPIALGGSDLVCYGALPAEAAPTLQAGTRRRAVGTRRNYLGVFQLYLPRGTDRGDVAVTYGDCREAPALVVNGERVAGSEDFPMQMRERMAELLADAEVAAHLSFASAPAVIEPRPYFVDV